MTLCVYALISAGRPPRARGMAGEPLHAVTVGGVTAVTSERRRLPSPTARNLRKYDAILGAIARSAPALLPVRFGTCFDSADELSFVLRSRQQSLRRALRHVRDRVQMTVRIVSPASAAAARPVSVSRGEPDKGRATGTSYLRARAEAAARSRDVPEFDSARARVRRWIRDERVERRARVTTIYHLVPRASAATYRTALQRVAAAEGLHVIVSGPWPPYAFADEFD